MFDISFPELLLILVVALVVIGPERLPRVARTMGFWVGRARSVFNSVRRDIEREARIDELKQAERDFRKDLDLGLNEDLTKEDDGKASAGKAGAGGGRDKRKAGAGAAAAPPSIADDDAPETTPSATVNGDGDGDGERGKGDNGNT